MLEPKKFDVCKNAVAPMIAMSSHSKLDMEISDTDMETTESNNYRGISRSDGNANSVLAMMWGGARFSYKDGQKFIDLFT